MLLALVRQHAAFNQFAGVVHHPLLNDLLDVFGLDVELWVCASEGFEGFFGGVGIVGHCLLLGVEKGT